MSATATTTASIAIGQGRRLTLAELYAVSTGLAELQWQDPTATDSVVALDEDALAVLSLDQLSLQADDAASESSSSSKNNNKFMLSTPETIAFFTILAFTVVQTEGNSSVAARQLVQAVGLINSRCNGGGGSMLLFCVPRDAAVAAAVMGKWCPESAVPVTTMQRSVALSQAALAVYKAALLSATCALPIAALSVDASGTAATLLQNCYSETAFDVLRPHRSMVSAAATLRAVLNESRYSNCNNDADGGGGDASSSSLMLLSALRDIPQYHGPATEQLTAAAKQLELEVNSRSVVATAGSASDDAVAALDPTLLDILTKQAATAVTVQLTKSLQRQGRSITAATTTSELTLPELVTAWEASLSEEAATAVRLIREATASAADDAAKKEAEKTARAAAASRGTAGGAAADEEFAGMSEANIAKILKKRAEKEAKAAAKSKAKEEKGASLFGAGTQAICQIMSQFVSQSEKVVYLLPGAAAGTGIGNNKDSLVLQLTAVTEKLLSGGVQRKPKIPKGTRDYLPEQMMIRQQAFSIIRRVFESHGAVEIDTPVFELKDTLTGKYGEDSKLIYDLADQGGELLALRYDLTVPFARFLALNNVGNIKRFHIGKVYRRDQPALKRGRYREFYQCDFDIAGVYGRMVPDSECLCVVCDILDALPIGDFAIKLNHRCLLDAILDICGVPADKFRTICSAVDKLDKEPWSEVKREMVEEKGLNESVAERIGEFVLNKGKPFELYKELMDAKRFGDHKGANKAMEDLRILFEYLEAFDKLKFISFDLSLARGLDYYTGVIYEAVCMSGNSQVGSIGGGGRYDNLVSMFQEAGKQTPCVGVSVGIERVFTLMEARLREEKGGSIKQPNVNVLVASAGGGLMKEKMKIARMLWDANISAEFSQQENAKLTKEVVNALDREIPFMVVIGENELAENKCQVKNIKAKTAELVLIPDLVSTLRKMGVIPVGCEFAAELLRQEDCK